MSNIKNIVKIAITGSMSSGKSVCSNILRELGYYVFDSDLAAKSCYEKSHPAYKDIIQLLGEEILDEEKEIVVDKVSSIIFNNPSTRIKLEEIIHPYIKDEIIKHSKNYEFFFAEVPLLFEASWQDMFDYILLITTSKEISLDRSVKQRGFTKEEAIKRFNAQLDVSYKIVRSNYVLYNDKTINEFKNDIISWLDKVKNGVKN